MENNKKHYVYILINNKKPIYVGCTDNIKNRINAHKSTKEFDSHLVLKVYKNKKDALIAENLLIRFVSIFGGSEWVNGKHKDLEILGEFLRSDQYNKTR